MEGRADVQALRKPPAVTIYTTVGCALRERAKAYFAEQGASYTGRDIASAAAARQDFPNLRGIGVPLIVVGNRPVHGLSVAHFARLYAGRRPSSPLRVRMAATAQVVSRSASSSTSAGTS